MSLTERTALGALLALCVAWLVTPIWIVSMPPMTDFGGHVMLADWWLRLGEEPALDALMGRRDGWWLPNLTLVRFAALVDPLLSVTTAIKLYTSLALVAQVGALLVLLRTLGRSPWLVFAMLPFLWNGMLSLGLLNYVAAMPLMTLVVAFAVRCGRDGGRTRDVVLLGATALVTFPVHALALLLVVPVALAAVWLSGDRRAALRGTLALAPSVLWLGLWMLATRGGDDADRLRITTLRVDKRFNIFVRESLDVLTSWSDNIVLAVIVIAALVTWYLLRRSNDEASEVPAAPAAAGRLRRIQAQARANPAATLAVLAFLLVYFLPTYMARDGMFIGPRLVPLFWWLALASLPVVGGPAARRFGLFMAAVALVYGALVVEGFWRYQRETVDGLEEVVARIPDEPGALAPPVICLGTWERRRLFRRAPLRHNCPAHAQTTADAWAGPGFATTPYNAVYVRDLDDLTALESRFVVLWGDPVQADLPPSGPGELLFRTEETVPGQFWSLYELPPRSNEVAP